MKKMILATLFVVFGINLTAADTKSMMYDENDKLWQKQTALQKRLPPKKLPMVTTNNVNVPYTDITMIADRQAILNQVTAYSFLIDEDRWEDWFALYSDDIVFETTTPCFGTIRTIGKKAFRKFVDVRFRGPGSESKNFAHRHTMGNMHVAYQDKKRAEVRTYMLISDAFPDGTFNLFTSGTYNATLEKRNGAWIITRWYIEVDGTVPKSSIPKMEGIEYIPDDRKECR
jgi:3-phenylpropionate/cinnamic acid dioxygenase small subunit